VSPKFRGDFTTLDLAAVCQVLGLDVRQANGDFKFWVRCPWVEEHSANGSSDTVIWQDPGKWPTFNCSHNHCAGRKLEDVIAWAEALRPGIIDEHCRQTWQSDGLNGHRPARVFPHRKPEIPTPEEAARNTEEFLDCFRVDQNDLWERSSIKSGEDWRRDAVLLLEHLYGPDEFVCLCTRYETQSKPDGTQKAVPSGAGSTMRVRELLDKIRRIGGVPQDKAGCWYRINPVSQRGSGANGAHCDKDVAAYRFLLLESDDLPSDLQLSFFLKLELPVVALVSSGGRSIHSIIRLDAPSAEEFKRLADHILNRLARFGIDQKNRNPSRYSRLPGAQRVIGAQTLLGEDSGQQRLLYFNHQPESFDQKAFDRQTEEKPVERPPEPQNHAETLESAVAVPATKLVFEGKPDTALVDGLDIYYDSSTKDFWATNDRAGWIRIRASDVRRWLLERGFKGRPKDDENVSEVDSLLTAIQRQNDVDYAGPLAGYRAGVYVINAARILVKDSPELLRAIPGEWPLLRGIIENMLGPEQSVFLFGWLKVALESLASTKFRVGQALTLAGPKDCGKSLIQQLITIMLGGRAAKPHRYMSGATPFNADLFGSEHLMVEDEEPSTDIRARRNFGTKIKEICANTVHSCHAKHRSALSLTPFWRVSISVNDEPENLMILPPVDESLTDKLIILKAGRHPMPMPTTTDEERSRFMDALKSELPHFAHFLFDWEIPADLVSQRYGITHYQHPEILTALGTLAPETRLLELIDSELFGSIAPGSWEGTASELERKLTGESSGVRREAGKLFSFPTACGTYLGRLQKLYPARFERDHARTGNRWTIDPPAL
jgi:hypothetical protein